MNIEIVNLGTVKIDGIIHGHFSQAVVNNPSLSEDLQAALVAYVQSVEQSAQGVNQPDANSIPLYKLRLWLIEAGLFAAVDAMIHDETKWPSTQEWQEAVTRWEHIPEVRRDSVMVNTLGAALGLTSAQIDAAFITANLLD